MNDVIYANLQMFIVMYLGIIDVTTIVEDLENDDDLLSSSPNFRYSSRCCLLIVHREF
jgi:hypothetical protein